VAAKSLDNNKLEANANGAAGANSEQVLGDVTVSDRVEVVGTFMVKFLRSTFSISKANY
jgi:hypothetical protein